MRDPAAPPLRPGARRGAPGALALLTALGAGTAAAQAPAPWTDMVDPAAPGALVRCAGLTGLLVRAMTDAPGATEAQRRQMGELAAAMLGGVEASERGGLVRRPPDPSPRARRGIGEASARYAATLERGALPGGHAAVDPYLRADIGLCLDALRMQVGPKD